MRATLDSRASGKGLWSWLTEAAEGECECVCGGPVSHCGSSPVQPTPSPKEAGEPLKMSVSPH